MTHTEISATVAKVVGIYKLSLSAALPPIMEECLRKLLVFVAEIVTDRGRKLFTLERESADPSRISIQFSTLCWFSDPWSHDIRDFRKLWMGSSAESSRERRKEGYEGSSRAALKGSSHKVCPAV